MRSIRNVMRQVIRLWRTNSAEKPVRMGRNPVPMDVLVKGAAVSMGWWRRFLFWARG
jgi:hypothetical protein